ncbi:MAG: PLP-dependent lyase/thiolase [Patescibacteria group bacterium]
MQHIYYPTPLIKISPLEELCSDVFIKREDLNPSGSHKDRALFTYLDTVIGTGEREFCLSSSGNFGISAAYYARYHPEIRLTIFFPPHLPFDKKKRLEGFKTDNTTVQWSIKARGDALRYSKTRHIRLLRASTDDDFLGGYRTLSRELQEQLQGTAGYIFCAVSSGTLLIGVWQGFQENPKSKACLEPSRGIHNPKLHIVQTTKVHPLAGEFDHDFEPTKTSLASAIVDRVAHRKAHVVQAIKESGGWGWVVGDSEIADCRLQIERSTGMKEVSAEDAMALAGLRKALRKGWHIAEPVVLIFTGK